MERLDVGVINATAIVRRTLKNYYFLNLHIYYIIFFYKNQKYDICWGDVRESDPPSPEPQPSVLPLN